MLKFLFEFFDFFTSQHEFLREQLILINYFLFFLLQITNNQNLFIKFFCKLLGIFWDCKSLII
jgi:hypothetical protein